MFPVKFSIFITQSKRGTVVIIMLIPKCSLEFRAVGMGIARDQSTIRPEFSHAARPVKVGRNEPRH